MSDKDDPTKPPSTNPSGRHPLDSGPSKTPGGPTKARITFWIAATAFGLYYLISGIVGLVSQ